MNIYCHVHRKISCQECRGPRAPKNELKHRLKRRELGLTICFWCKDTGHVTTFTGSGGKRIGCRMDSHKCACRCFLEACDQLATFENGYCADHQSDVPTPINLRGLFGEEC